MKFLKKNWSKLVFGVLYLTGAVLMMIPVFMLKNFNFIAACQTIGMVIFFAGSLTFVCIKMFDKSKPYGKYVLVATGVLVLTFMSIGAAGICKEKDKAQGAVGKAYSYFANVEPNVKAGKEKFDAGTAQRDGLAALNTNISSGFALPGTNEEHPLYGKLGAFANVKVKDIDPTTAGPLQEALTGIKAGLVQAGLSELTLSQTPVALNVMIGAATTQLKTAQDELAIGESQVKDANAASYTILFLYISVMIVFGLVPIIGGTKKLLCKKEAKK